MLFEFNEKFNLRKGLPYLQFKMHKNSYFLFHIFSFLCNILRKVLEQSLLFQTNILSTLLYTL